MSTRRPPRAPWRAAPLAAAAVTAAALACELPKPTSPRVPDRVPVASIASADPRYAPDAQGRTPVEAVRAVVADRFPDLLRNPVGRRQQLWVVQQADGFIDRVARVSAHPAQTFRFGRAVLAVDDTSKVMRVTGRPATAAGPGATDDPGAALLATIDPARINTVEILRIPPGRVAPDSLTVVWVRLRPGGGPAAPGGALALAASTEGAGGRITLAMGTDGAPNGISSAGLDAPLFFVDGREVAGPAELPPRDRIRSVDVLKGEAARQRYGERAGGGAVLITTKPGSVVR